MEVLKMKTAQDFVNESGYPLQIHLEKLIEETKQEHKWRVAVSEHRWVNAETKDEGYIDLVLEREGLNLKLVVECKRIIGSWTFLLPMAQPFNKPDTRTLSIDYKTFRFLWNKIHIWPESYEAAFCVMETGGKKDSRTLEKLAGELLLSLEYLAIEETALMKALYENSPPLPFADHKFYIPVIVTTADLQAMSFNPSNIDLKTGIVAGSNAETVEFIRFRKNLATHIDYEKPQSYTLRDLNQENDRTVFVVHTESFIKFLKMINDY